jgi:hypothetical protein
VPELTRRAIGRLAAGTVLLPAAATLAAEPPALRAELAGLRRLVGTWRGEGQGEPGNSRVERHFEPILGGMFLQVRNRSVYAPQPANPKGETHEDMGLIGFDKARRVAVFRQFHTESFVNQYTAPADGLAGGQIVFETEAIENIPPGFRARETWRFDGPDRFEEIFEIAEPGKAFALYTHNRLRRS